MRAACFACPPRSQSNMTRRLDGLLPNFPPQRNRVRNPFRICATYGVWTGDVNVLSGRMFSTLARRRWSSFALGNVDSLVRLRPSSSSPVLLRTPPSSLTSRSPCLSRPQSLSRSILHTLSLSWPPRALGRPTLGDLPLIIGKIVLPRSRFRALAFSLYHTAVRWPKTNVPRPHPENVLQRHTPWSHLRAL